MSMTDIKNIEKYVTAGEATFTLENPATGNRYTYKVKEVPKKPGEMWWVSTLVGPDNEQDYQYLGSMVYDQRLGGRYYGKHTAGSKLPNTSPQFKGLLWLCTVISQHEGELNSPILFHHSGKCARCGRTLTTPESIEIGMGPVCAEKSIDSRK